MSNYSSVDPIKVIVMTELERAFAILVEPLAEHVSKKLRRDYQYKERPSDPLRRVERKLRGTVPSEEPKSKPKLVTLVMPSVEGDKLRALRKEAKMSQMTFAKLVGVNQTDISKMELGRKPIPQKVWDFVGLRKEESA